MNQLFANNALRLRLKIGRKIIPKIDTLTYGMHSLHGIQIRSFSCWIADFQKYVCAYSNTSRE